MALYADVPNAALRKLIDAIALSTRQPNGTILTEYVDGQGKQVAAGVPSDKQAVLGKATEFELSVRINPDGNSAAAKVLCKSPKGIYSIEGQIDTAILATKLV